MRVLKIHQLQMAVAILFVILVVCFFYDGRNDTMISGYTEYNGSWSCWSKNEQISYHQLPQRIQGVREIVLSRELSEEYVLGNYIGFYTSNQTVEAYIDSKLIYKLEVPENIKSRTPGKCWNFIRIPPGSKGSTLEIHIKESYRIGGIILPQFYQGQKSAILLKEIRENLLFLILSIIMLVVGLTMWVLWIVMKKRMILHQGMLWLSLFTIHLAIWSGVETQVMQILFGRNILFNQIACMCLKLMICPAIRFMQVVCHMEENKLMNLFCIAGVIDFSISFICQFFGWVDYEQTLWLTQFIGIGGGITAVLAAGRLLIRNSRKLRKHRKQILINIIGIAVIMMCNIIDALNYYYGCYKDMAKLSRIGWLIYIIMLAFQLLSNSAKLIKAGKEAESIREEAELDGLTRIKNRRCFEEDMAKIPASEYEKYAMVMFDLNDLKKMNDIYGHGMGDCYLIISSEIIRDLFEEFGELYRIGGDEFCLLSDSLTQEEYERREQRMCIWMESLKGSQVRKFMKVASGYAGYNKNRDMNLQDIMERADKRMYQRKKELKRQEK